MSHRRPGFAINTASIVDSNSQFDRLTFNLIQLIKMAPKSATKKPAAAKTPAEKTPKASKTPKVGADGKPVKGKRHGQNT